MVENGVASEIATGCASGYVPPPGVSIGAAVTSMGGKYRRPAQIPTQIAIRIAAITHTALPERCGVGLGFGTGTGGASATVLTTGAGGLAESASSAAGADGKR